MKKYWRVKFNEPTWNLPSSWPFFLERFRYFRPRFWFCFGPMWCSWVIGTCTSTTCSTCWWEMRSCWITLGTCTTCSCINRIGPCRIMSDQDKDPNEIKNEIKANFSKESRDQQTGRGFDISTQERNGKRQPHHAGSCIIGTGTSTVCSTCWCWTRCWVITFGTWTTSSCRQKFRAESQKDISQVPKGFKDSAPQLLSANPLLSLTGKRIKTSLWSTIPSPPAAWELGPPQSAQPAGGTVLGRKERLSGKIGGGRRYEYCSGSNCVSLRSIHAE